MIAYRLILKDRHEGNSQPFSPLSGSFARKLAYKADRWAMLSEWAGTSGFAAESLMSPGMLALLRAQ